MKTVFHLFAITAVTFIAGGQSVHGQFILSPVTVTETGLGTFSPNTAGLTNMINQSGLASHPFVSGTTLFDTYFTPNDKFSGNADFTKWQSDYSFSTLPPGNLDFDLGAEYLVSKIAIWNVSLKDISIYVSSDLAGLDTESPVGTFTLPDDNTASVSIRANILDFGGVHQGRYLRIHITSEYPYSGGIYYATVGEVAVSAQPTSNVGTPTISATRESNGDVTLNFSGALQSKANIQDSFQNVSGNPQSTYTIPKANLAGRQFFRSSN